MDKKGVKSIIITGALVVVLALAGTVYPKIVDWYENVINGGAADISGTPAATNAALTDPAKPTDPATPTATGGNGTNTDPGEPVTVTDVPLASPTGNGGAQDFYIVDKDGKTVRLSDFYGKPIIVNVWASWCYYCKEEFPYFKDALSVYGDKVRFMFVDLCDGVEETRAKADKFMKSRGYDFPVYYETLDKVLDLYNSGGIPLTLFIDKDGIVYYSKLGAFSSQSSLFRKIDELLKQ